MWVELSLGLRPIKTHSSNYKVRNNSCVLGILGTRMKISVLTDISVLRFYGYIGYIGDISVDIFI